LTPVSFKNQEVGFRVTKWAIGSGGNKPKPIIAYLALSDTPTDVSEDDMEMTMDNGEWVKPENSRILAIEKLGWDAEQMIRNAESIMQDPKRMRGREATQLWNTLVEKGLITTNAESQSVASPIPSPEPPEAEQALPPVITPEATQPTPEPETSGTPSRLWVCIVGGILLCAILGLVLARK